MAVPSDGSGTSGPTPDYQSPYARIIGNVAGGGDLPPFSGTPEAPLPWYFYSWGPRSYSAGGKLLNLSARAYVAVDRPLISGFVVSPGSRIVLIRAVGPTLTIFGVPTVLARPHLELFDSKGASVAVAVPWSATNFSAQSEMAKATAAVGGFALKTGSQDAVLLAVLDPGNYTSVVSGTSGNEGNAMLEAYDVPQSTATLPPAPPPTTGLPVLTPGAGEGGS